MESRWLSNFVGGVEEEFQAGKSTDPNEIEKILNASSPREAKRLGRKTPIRRDWEQIKIAHMKWCLDEKFSPGSEFADKLIKTGDAVLIEGNTWHDNTWGNCTCIKCIDKRGLNWLGILLMLRRSELILLKSLIPNVKMGIRL